MSCAGSPAVTFDVTVWKARYPEFNAVDPTLAGLYFQEATLYCANKLNPVPNVPTLAMLLNMLTAHIAALNSPTTASGASPATPPGRLSNATEGSVSAAFQNDYPPGTPQWFQSTKYGSAFWAATLAFRLFRYRPKATFSFSPASQGGMPWLYPPGS